MAVGKTTEKGAAEVEEGETAAAEKGAKKGPTAEEKGKGVAAEEAGKVVVAYGDTITLKSSDGKPFEVSKEAAARLSERLAQMIASGGCIDGGGIDLDSIGAEALEKVVDYCNKRDPVAAAASGSRSFEFSTAAPSKELEDSDRELVDRLSTDDLFDLVEAADFLKMDGLLDVTCRKIADMMRGKNTAQIREIFNIENDYTMGEEEEVLKEHDWAFGE
ncbi:unnamed protein product [Urochloa decumbens]|uniref:SKP1-like protein n=1 Tax=Urochloa decumbens TaxID=240449 RepID=A0ABC9ER83_9POAL